MSAFNGGPHTITAAWKKLNAEDAQGYRQLTIQNPNASGGNSMFLSFDGVKDMGVIPPDRAWTFGPNCGTIHPNQVWLRGTAADTAYYNGALV